MSSPNDFDLVFFEGGESSWFDFRSTGMGLVDE